ncbi:hypothetical protein PAL_GLEAN10002683 [Pteropus alecto]|uniref:Uncharacterized protein n=1 Tax=Pteropus alecto TaxID=9402 RepID=L5KFF1_PTEAL|nr:hypothetical protein PAL_GLEAN10002683 [Pteropus alecto]
MQDDLGGSEMTLWGDSLVCRVLAFVGRPWYGPIGHRPSTEVTPVPAMEQTATTLHYCNPDLRSSEEPESSEPPCDKPG